jgi:hypothetical protein
MADTRVYRRPIASSGQGTRDPSGLPSMLASFRMLQLTRVGAGIVHAALSYFLLTSNVIITKR